MRSSRMPRIVRGVPLESPTQQDAGANVQRNGIGNEGNRRRASNEKLLLGRNGIWPLNVVCLEIGERQAGRKALSGNEGPKRRGTASIRD